MKTKQPPPFRDASSASDGSRAMRYDPELLGSGTRPTETAQTTPFMGTEPAFMSAALHALTRLATRLAFHPRPVLPSPLPESLPHSACPTIWTRVRGLCESRREGLRTALSVAASALESVPGTEARGRMWISRVACEGDSRFGRISMGPDKDARACV